MSGTLLELIESAGKPGKGIRWLMHQLKARNVERDVAISVAEEFAGVRGITLESVQPTFDRLFNAKSTRQSNIDEILKLDGKSLLQREFPPLRFVIDGFLQPGFTVLACRPKFGKSFLSLQIAIAVATGQKAFGRFDVLRAC